MMVLRFYDFWKLCRYSAVYAYLVFKATSSPVLFIAMLLPHYPYSAVLHNIQLNECGYICIVAYIISSETEFLNPGTKYTSKY